MEKKNTGLVITIIILVVLLLGLGGYICYDKFYLDKKESNEVAEKNKDNNQTAEENKDNNTTPTSNSFSLFAKTLKENRAKQEEKDKQKGLSISGDTYSARLEEIGDYDIKLDYDGTLSVTYGNKNYKKYNTTIDTDVLFYEIVGKGNGGFKWLYYVKDDGKLYVADVEYGPYSDNKKAVGQVEDGYKDIIGIKQEFISEGSTGFHDAVLVDINGNTYFFSKRGE